MRTWYSADENDTDAQERLTGAWIDAPLDNLEVCAMLLEIARDQVWVYAPECGGVDDDGAPIVPVIDTGDLVPARLVMAQLQQATNLWNAGRVNSSGDVGMDSFSFTPRPLDKTIRSMIRPTKGTVDVG